ncbi:MAG: hypothetical protein CO108_11605 [Deltaproteobacteria bacterium CG_4_9_14_3_um_filter_63_12]|nr:MAG: hypothetical protein CO108_11605 [Deltaproteobacteria bacterium CG_4_9_14_3_um_filter_63_12]
MRRRNHRQPVATMASIRIGMLVLVTLLASSTAALAQGSPKLYMPDFVGYQNQAQSRIVEQITKVVRQRLDADPTVAVLPQLTGATEVISVSPAITEATRLYEAGRGQYVDQRFEDAAKSLTQALDYLETNTTDITDWSMVEDSLFRLSIAYQHIGDETQSSEMIRRLLAYNPEFTFASDEELPEAYAASFADSVKRLKKKGNGSLDTSSVEVGAEIWVDGKVRGATPMSIEDLGAGTHFVVLRKDGAAYGSLVTIEAKKATALSASLVKKGAEGSPEAALVGALATGEIGDSVRFAARDLANRSAAAYVVAALIVPVDEGFAVQALLYTTETKTLRLLEPSIFDKELLSVNVDGYKLSKKVIDAIFDASLGTVVESTEVIGPENFKAKSEVTALVTGKVLPDYTNDVDTTTDETNSDTTIVTPKDEELIKGFPLAQDHWYENPWLWTGVGVGVAGAAILTIVLMSDSGTDVTGFNATIEW